ncbi:Casp-like protein 1e1 [Thalictrum thalictroides]|uniref:CASP-like protein n=1 Tax=Thalictrum thalictroides TaxID=46969 RepID=A0A7J6X9N1_THATH|nr:Casp-like protein 1e1 [Thalictrum thalictroides]
MESSSFSKPSNMDGTQGIESGVKVANPRTVRSSDFFLRFLALITSLVAIIVLATSKETEIVPVIVIPTLPAINVELSAKWQYVQAFVFFMVINIIACVYAAISLVLSIASRAGSKGLLLMLIILDLVMMALLFSANGAAAAIGLIGVHGNSHLRWNKICNIFGSNCQHVVASVVVSTIGASVFLLLILLTVVNLQKRSH